MSQETKDIPTNTCRDRINEVRVLGLFGVFDHRIPLCHNSHVTVIHGPNGVGKTIILRMIRELLTGIPDVFKRVPFDNFEVDFVSGDRICLTQKRIDQSASKIDEIRYTATLNSKVKKGEYFTGPSEKQARKIAGMLGDTWVYKGDGHWVDRRDGETLDLEAVVERLPNSMRKEIRPYEDDVLEAIRQKCNVRMIGTDRLTDKRLASDIYARRYQTGNDFSQTAARHMYSMRQSMPSFESEDRTIARYSRDLTFRLSEALSAYGRLTEQLDRSLVKRLLVRDFESKTPNEVLDEFRKIDENRSVLTSLGLLNQTEDVLVRDGDGDVLALISKSIDVFSIYVQDMQRKLALYDNLRKKVSILLERTKARFQFKRLVIDPNDGLVFLSDSGIRLAVSDLSSGEQHEMILFYDLLFFASEEDLILIDEPEISLHIEWQMEFLADLSAALQSSQTRVLVATHSPAIAQAARDALVPLGQ